MAKEVTNNSGIVSVIFGILGILSIILTALAIFAPVFGFCLSFLALIFGIVQFKSDKNSWAKAGIILAILGLIINVIVFSFEVSIISDFIAKVQPIMEAARQQQELLSQLQYAQTI